MHTADATGEGIHLAAQAIHHGFVRFAGRSQGVPRRHIEVAQTRQLVHHRHLRLVFGVVIVHHTQQPDLLGVDLGSEWVQYLPFPHRLGRQDAPRTKRHDDAQGFGWKCRLCQCHAHGHGRQGGGLNQVATVEHVG